MKTFNDDARLQNFPAWSGAKETKAAILAANKGAEFEGLIEELYPDGIGETALNDILRFESDWVFESLGLDPETGEEIGEEEENENEGENEGEGAL